MKNIIKNSSDFLFIYEAIQCNPNGDPDQENKPRMDYDTSTNLVTDTRLKRYIRDYLKEKGYEIFVDFVEDRQVNMGQRIEGIIKKLVEEELLQLESIFKDKSLYKLLNEIINAAKIKASDKKENYLDVLWNTLTTSSKTEKDNLQKDKYLKQFYGELNKIRTLNLILLVHIVKQKYIDIRLFGSAFAIAGFNHPFTGPIQINWGYSFNKVELMDSSSIVTIMNDDSSTFGKDYRVHYSLLGFNGTINANMAKITGLTDEDVQEFRNSIWEAVPANPTRSKLNQYPKLYVEVVYNEGISNGQFGDLRNMVEVKTREKLTDKQVRRFSDLDFNIEKLIKILNENKGIDKKIKEIIIKKSADLNETK